MAPKKHTPCLSSPQVTAKNPLQFLHKALVHCTGALGLLISVSFFTATFDTAQVKLTLLHMGSWLLLALWSSLKLAQRQNPFCYKNLPFLLPVLAYIGWNMLCYIFAPLHAEAAEEFIRFVIYGAITLLAATEFTLQDIKTITRWLLGAIVISFVYGAIQIVDGFFPGVDPMPWRGFFTKRIFSTHANPNFFADFIIFSSCILGGVYLACHQKKWLFWAGLGAVLIFFTESKGAWLAYAAAGAFGIWLYVSYGPSSLKKFSKKINAVALVALLAVGLLAGMYAVKRFQSVSFRLHTWLGTVEMIKASPIMGVGVGNFKTIYSAYRRPQIFYIENAHNVETQHAENELLEQWAVSGTVGLALFLWLLLFIFTAALHTLKNTPPQEEKQAYLIGYTAALGGMFVHSWVDISIHFASSGFFFALFMGILLALARTPQPLPVTAPASCNGILQVERGLIVLSVTALSVWLVVNFHQVTDVLGLKTVGEFLLIALAWAVFLGCVAGGAFVVIKSAWRVHRASALLPLLLLVLIEVAAYRPFQANHVYSLAITLNNLGNLEGALGFFTKAIQLDPLKSEYRQFRANLLSNTFDLTKRFSPMRGDKKAPSDDYTRALADYSTVEKRSPNHPLLYHNQGQLYYRMALARSDASGRAHSQTEHELFKQEALSNMQKAKASFVRSLRTDPVNPDTYIYLIQIGLLENDLEEAQRWLDKLYQGPDGVSEEEFLTKYRNYPPAKQLQAQLEMRRSARGR